MNRDPQDVVVETDLIGIDVAFPVEIAKLSVVPHPFNCKDPHIALVYACNRSIIIDRNETWNPRRLL